MGSNSINESNIPLEQGTAIEEGRNEQVRHHSSIENTKSSIKEPKNISERKYYEPSSKSNTSIHDNINFNSKNSLPIIQDNTADVIKKSIIMLIVVGVLMYVLSSGANIFRGYTQSSSKTHSTSHSLNTNSSSGTVTQNTQGGQSDGEYIIIDNGGDPLNPNISNEDTDVKIDDFGNGRVKIG